MPAETDSQMPENKAGKCAVELTALPKIVAFPYSKDSLCQETYADM
jgi:hypothetical protein